MEKNNISTSSEEFLYFHPQKSYSPPMEREKIIQFLHQTGIQVVETELPGDCFLPGLALGQNTILMDPEQLKFPGDLLHEAGHLAVTDPEQRSKIGTEEMDPEWPSQGDEIAAILWSYAALRFLEIEPEVVFHPEGYKGQSAWLIESFNSGNYIGLPLLEWMGLCNGPEKAAKTGTKAFPDMLKWVR